MSADAWQGALREVSGVAGVRGAIIISAEDGLVVAETAMDDLATADVAALSAALVSRATRCTVAMRAAPPESVHLSADHGSVLAVAGPESLWLVAVARHDAELGRLRLVMRDFASTLR